MGNFDKPYEELSFTDNFMFVYMMGHYPDLCREMLELILPVKIDRIESISTEHTIANSYDSRGVRLDALMKDSEGNIYDAEMQVVVESDLPKRSRYYHSAIDMDALSRGKKYCELNPVYVIFICREALSFSRQAPVYVFRSIDSETGEVLSDLRYTVLVNSDYVNQTVGGPCPEELEEFLYLVNKGKTRKQGDTFANRIDKLVKRIKSEKRERGKYMTAYEQMLMDIEAHKDEWQEEARAEGRAEGLEKGRAEGIHALMQLVKNDFITPENAAESLGITVEEFNFKAELLKQKI